MDSFRKKSFFLVENALDFTADELFEKVHEVASEERGLNVLGWLHLPMRWFDLPENPEPHLKVHRSVPEGWLDGWKAMIRTYPDIDVLRGLTVPLNYTSGDLRRHSNLMGQEEASLRLNLKYGMRDLLTCPVAGRYIFSYWSKKPIELPWSDRAILQMSAAICCVRSWMEQPIAHPFKDPSLTPRELAVLRAYSLGKDQSSAALHMGLSPETIKSYVKSARRKLNAQTTAQAVANAIRMRLIS